MNEYRFAALSIGLRESFSVVITKNMLDSFFALSGDVNPLHTNSDYAAACGFQDQVVHGMLTASFYSTLVGVYLPGKFSLLQGADISFQSPVYVGDTLSVEGEVKYLNEAYRQMEVSARILNQHGNRVSKAKLRVGLYA